MLNQVELQDKCQEVQEVCPDSQEASQEVKVSQEVKDSQAKEEINHQAKAHKWMKLID